MFSRARINDRPACCFIIRCCLFNHFIIHISWYTLLYLWIVVFTMCNTDLSLFSQASCRKESCHRHDLSSRHTPTSPLSLGTSDRGKWILDYSNMLIFFPLTFSFFTKGQRLDGVWSFCLVQSCKLWSAYLALYTLNVRIKCLITLTMTAESHGSFRAPATIQLAG